MKITKRDCSEVEFDKNKIYEAIMKAMTFGSGIIKPDIAKEIAAEIESEAHYIEDLDIYRIESMVFEKLIGKNETLTAKAYEGYRRVREFQRDVKNSTDESIMELLTRKSDYWNEENSNKNAMLVTTQRDYMAGIESEDISKRMLLTPDIIQSHEDGIIHFHDIDYFGQNAIHNCFDSKTKFITSEGIKQFSDFKDGDNAIVLDKNGIFRKATVKNYGKQQMYDIVFTTSKREKTVTCTKNHRWLLKNGTVTTDLKVGDTLIPLVNNTKNNIPKTFDECKMFAIGFLIGDGCDHKNQNIHQIRLCGHKTKYVEIFKKAGYHVDNLKDTTDCIVTKKGCIKQEFLNSGAWKYMNVLDKKYIFAGLYAADGATNAHKICTVDDRVANLIEDISFAAGYHITSKTFETRDTEYKKNSTLIAYRFTLSQPANLCWKVKSITPHFNISNTPIEAWCVEEPITHSFTLEGGMVTGNCDLINLEDMLQNGTVISGVMIEKPHSFSTACNVATQIIAQVASSQYGGQSISLSHLAPFVDVSRNKIKAEVETELKDVMCSKSEGFSKKALINNIVEKRLRKEIEKGVQTIQYQVVTLMTTNGQAPFLSVFMYLNEVKDIQTKNDLALIIEEVLKQRIQGVKNEKGVWVTPAFPKLLYVLEDDNTYENSKYFYLTKLAAKCSAKRLVPDYISEKIMLENKVDKNGNGHCYPCMGCRSFLTPYIDENGQPKYYGRFNQGVVTINLPDIALSSGGDIETFWKLFDARTELCHKALQLRHQRLESTPSDVAPILWQYGAISRLQKGETIDKLLHNGYSTISLGYAGLYECVKYMTGVSHTDGDFGEAFGLKVMKALNDKCQEWKEAEHIDYSLYGSPIESTTYKFAKCLRKRFGVIKGITDRDYITNSYHVPVFEEINAFDKLAIESKFQKLSPGGAISYVEIPNMNDNIQVVIQIIQFIYENIMYAELNSKSDYCMVCGYDKEIKIVTDENSGKLIWECPQCGNRDQTKMSVARRTCGYIGSQFWNQGRTQEIKERVLHIDDKEYKEE